jgi:lantibiotic biosynthesis protein
MEAYERQRLLHESLEKIADECPGFKPKQNNVGLLDGKAGLVLFYAYLYRQSNDERHFDLFSRLLDECILEIGDATLGSSFVAGITGIGWLIRHLVDIGLIDDSSLSLLQVIEPHILESLQSDEEAKNFEFFTGTAGKGIYFLEGQMTEASREGIGQILKILKTGAIPQDHGIAWLTRSRTTGEIYYDMGLPHGIPGIILFLCKVFKAGIYRDEAAELIKGAVDWILSKEQHLGMGYFPHIIGREFAGRVAWCYGDLGVAAALLEASAILLSPELKEKALSIFRKEASRDIQSAMVFKNERFDMFDRGFCHGTAGIALFFNIYYKRTRIDALRAAADYWTDFTLSIKKTGKGRGIGGYIFPTPASRDIWRKSPYVLEGSGGVGLCYLSLLNDQPLPWEKIFLF